MLLDLVTWYVPYTQVEPSTTHLMTLQGVDVLQQARKPYKAPPAWAS